MGDVVLYATEYCPRCIVLSGLLEQNSIEYRKILDANMIIAKGYTSAPILEVDGETMSYTEAYNWVLKAGEK